MRDNFIEASQVLTSYLVVILIVQAAMSDYLNKV